MVACSDTDDVVGPEDNHTILLEFHILPAVFYLGEGHSIEARVSIRSRFSNYYFFHYDKCKHFEILSHIIPNGI